MEKLSKFDFLWCPTLQVTRVVPAGWKLLLSWKCYLLCAAGFPSHWLKYCILQRGNLEVRGNIKPILSLLSAKYWFWHYQSTQHHCSDILPGIRDGFEWHDLQGWYFPIHTLLPGECIGKYSPGTIFNDYNPQGKYQAHIPVCRSHHSKSSLLPGVQF